MAFPSEASVDAAIDTLISVAKENKTRVGARKLYRDIVKLVRQIERVEPTTYADLWADGSYTSDYDAA